MKKEEFTIPIEFEGLLKTLFGQANYHGATGHYNITRLKKIYSSIISSLKRSIKINLVNIDNIHITKLVELCDKAIYTIKQSDNIDRVNVSVILFFTELSFLLIGDLPENWNCQKTINDKCWKLNKHRSIFYLSDEMQKSFTILDNFKNFSNELKPFSENEMWDKLNYEFGNNYSKFVKWFKIEFPLVYIKIL
ncbi:MAG: hypothetical protein IPM32_02340 [Ignavibacteriae bacterium]|nr:hypothetical protein [Ignavibacteriota bacterium]